MDPRRWCVTAVLAACMALCGAAAQAQTPAGEAAGQAARPRAVVDQRALDILKQMSETIGLAKTASFTALSMVPVREPGGMWISLFGKSRVVMEGRSAFFAETRGDFFPYDFYYDGKTITAYAPTKNLFAVKNVPGTIDGVIENAYREEGGSFPYADIIIARSYDTLTKGLTSALYVGQSTIDGVLADHLAFMNGGNVAWQIWIGAEDHLPRLVTATYLDTYDEPSYTVEFKDWKLNGPVAPGTFSYTNTTNAAQIEFRSPGKVKARPGSMPAESAR